MTPNTITASQVPLMLGQSKWGTPLTLYYDLIGEGPPREDNELLAEGRAFERTIAEIAEQKFAIGLVPTPVLQRFENLSGHPDFAVIVDGKRHAILEVKNTLFHDVGEEIGWGEPGTDRVPTAYWLQCQVYGNLMQRSFPDTAHDEVLLAARLRSGVQLYRIPIDHDVFARINEEAGQFLDRVESRNPPDPQTIDDFRRRWAVVDKKIATGASEQLELARSYARLGREIKALEAQREEVGMHLLGYMQDAQVLEVDGRKIATASVNRKFNSDKFITLHPEIASMFTKLDTAAISKHYRHLYETCMEVPESPAQQTRVLRVSLKEEEA